MILTITCIGAAIAGGILLWPRQPKRDRQSTAFARYLRDLNARL